MLSANGRRIAELAAQHRLPAMYWPSWFVEAGGLVAYSPDYDAMMRRAASYVDRILKGARPAASSSPRSSTSWSTSRPRRLSA